MAESYSGRSSKGGARPPSAPTSVAESSASMASTRELLLQLLPGVDSERLIRALLAEREPIADVPPEQSRYDSDREVCARELHRVRAQFVLGESSRNLQHAFNNPLTALLAEAQLLELEPLPDEHRASVSRILELARRLVTLSRRLNAVDSVGTIG